MRVLFIGLLFSSLSAHGQWLLEPSLNPDQFICQFSEHFIRENSIREIGIEKSSKSPGASMKKLRNSKHLVYHEDGKLSQTLLVAPLFGKMDTSLTVFKKKQKLTYSNSGCKLEIERNVGFQTLNTTYACRCEINGLNVVILDSNWVGTEHIHERNLGGQRSLREYKNSNGLPFMHETIQFDSLGFVRKEIRMYLTTRQIEEWSYLYNRKGLISKIHQRSDINKSDIKGSFKYDDFGSLTAYSITRNGNPYTEGELVIGDTALPDGAVEQKANGEIMMYKFTYEFYD